MKFVADEGLDAPIVEALRNNGHEVFYIKEECPGSSDEQVLQISNNLKEILIAQDKDFGELVYRMKQVHAGVILVRLSGLKPQRKGCDCSRYCK
jgi:predicted nuclease of predicted toxin-antitoxin system